MIDIKKYASSSKGNLYSIDDGTTVLLLECGLPIAKIRKHLAYQLHNVSGCLVSHKHNDHSHSIRQLTKAGTDVYASQETFDHHMVDNFRTRVIKNNQKFFIDSWVVWCFSTVHDHESQRCQESLWFLLYSKATAEYLAFITDTAYIMQRLSGVKLDYLMIEANYQFYILNENVKNRDIDDFRANRIMATHLEIGQVLGFLKHNDLSNLKEIHLLHCSDLNSDKDEMKKIVQEFTGLPVTI